LVQKVQVRVLATEHFGRDCALWDGLIGVSSTKLHTRDFEAGGAA
jgi:hypothetical protein